MILSTSKLRPRDTRSEGATTAARTARFRACTAWDGHFRFTTGFMEQPPIVTYPVLWETQRQYELLEAEYGVSTNVSATLGVAARWFAGPITWDEYFDEKLNPSFDWFI